MFDDIIGKNEKKVRCKANICPHCGNFFMIFEGVDINIEEQPCPHCFKSRNNKLWSREKVDEHNRRMKKLIDSKD